MPRTTIGDPGSSAVIATRPIAAQWRTMRRSRKIWLFILAGTLGAFAGMAGLDGPTTSTNALYGAGIAITALLVLIGLFVAPSALLVTVIVGVTTAALAPLGALYTLMAGSEPDMVGGAVALFVAYGLGVWFLARHGHGRTWVSIAVLSASLLFPGLVLVALWPDLGLNAARLALLLAVFVRSGVIPWLLAAGGLLVDRIAHRDTDTALERTVKFHGGAAADVSAKAAAKRAAYGEHASVGVLNGLSNEFKVLHDVTVKPGRAARLTGADLVVAPHVVIGPTGLWVLASVTATSPMVDTTAVTGTLTIPGVDVPVVVAKLLTARAAVAAALHVPVRDAQIAVLVHGSDCVRSRFAVIDRGNGTQPCDVEVVAAGDAVALVDHPLRFWSRVTVRQVSRRAVLKLTPAHHQVSRSVKRKKNAEVVVPVRERRVAIRPLDQDGRISSDLPFPQDSGTGGGGVGFGSQPQLFDND